MPTITIEHVESWRSPWWDDHVSSREAWLVTCSEHSYVGHDSSGQPWGYARPGIASGVVSRHGTAYHRNGYQIIRREAS